MIGGDSHYNFVGVISAFSDSKSKRLSSSLNSI